MTRRVQPAAPGRLGRAVWLSLAAIAAGTPEAQAAPTVDSVFSLRTDAWTGDRDLTDRSGIATASLWGRVKLDDPTWGQVLANGWLRARTREDGEPHPALVRELYWRHAFGPVDVKLGRQLTIWGRADGLNPTDNLSPRDFRLLAPEDTDTRYGNDGIEVEATLPVGNASLAWFPRIHSDTVPLQAVAGVAYVDPKPRGGQWAARWEYVGLGSVDGSVSYVDGRDPMPDLTPGAVSAHGLDVVLRNQHLRVFGADVSTVRDGVVWRAEAALTRTDSQGANDFQHKKPQAWFVGGAEWTLAESTTLGVQATWLHVQGFQSPDDDPTNPLRDLAWRQLALSGQTASNQVGVVWRLARRLRNDTVTLEANGVAIRPTDGGSGSGLLRARANVALDDQWSLAVGGDRYYGPQDSVFGQLKGNSLAYVQLRRTF